jgi:hypothetical protein
MDGTGWGVYTTVWALWAHPASKPVINKQTTTAAWEVFLLGSTAIWLARWISMVAAW